VQRGAGAQQVALTDHLVERPGAHADRKRRAVHVVGRGGEQVVLPHAATVAALAAAGHLADW
jgi:hypothetical protein